MIKGCQRKMIILREPSYSFEAAYLILKSDTPPSVRETELLSEAERLIAAADSDSSAGRRDSERFGGSKDSKGLEKNPQVSPSNSGFSGYAASGSSLRNSSVRGSGEIGEKNEALPKHSRHGGSAFRLSIAAAYLSGAATAALAALLISLF